MKKTNKLKSQKIALAFRKQEIIVKALVFGALGFHRHIWDTSIWVVTHLLTGKAVCQSTNKQAIKNYVLNYGQESFWHDWENESGKDAIRLTLSGNLMNPRSSRGNQ